MMFRVIKLVSIVLLTMLFGLSRSALGQLVVHNNGAEVSVTTGCIVHVRTGNLTNGSGTIDNAGRLTVEGDLVNNDVLTGFGANTGIFNVSGDWENNATFNADQSLVRLNGAAQSVTGTNVSTFYNLQLQGAGIKSLTLDAIVDNTLELNAFELNTDVHTLHVTNTASAAVTENGGFVSSLGNGRLAWDMNSTDTYVLPLGSSVGTTRVRPLALTPQNANLNTFAARFANVDATSEGYDVNLSGSELCFVNDQFYYQIDQVAGTDAADVTQYFDAAQDGSWAAGAHWQGLPQWEDMGNEVIAAVGGYTTVTTPAWSDFSQPAFALANNLPDVSIDAVAPLCGSSAPIELGATPVGGDYYGNGVSNGMFNPATVGQGVHTVSYVYTDALGCTNTAEIDIEVNEGPLVTITSSNNGALELCDGETMDLTATPGFVSYEWSTTEQGEAITVSEGGQYQVTATDADGCVGTSVVANVTVQPNPSPVLTANGPVEFCEGESVLLATAANQGAYEWEGSFSTGPTTVVDESGDYWVTVTNQFGCVGVSNTITLDVTPMDDAIITNDGNTLTVSPAGTGYQWFLNGDPIPGATDLSYEAIQSGNYHVEYIGPNGCPTVSSTLEFTLQVGIRESRIISSLDVFPNPGTGLINVRGSLRSMEDVSIDVRDMLGRIVTQPVSFNGTMEFNTRIDISTLANGVYMIRVMTEDGHMTVRYIKS